MISETVRSISIRSFSFLMTGSSVAASANSKSLKSTISRVIWPPWMAVRMAVAEVSAVISNAVPASGLLTLGEREDGVEGDSGEDAEEARLDEGRNG